MSNAPSRRRSFLKSTLAAAGAAALARRAQAAPDAGAPAKAPRIKFSVIGVNHAHVHRQIEAVIRGGGQFVSFFAREPDLAEPFAKRYPQAKQARSEKEILESDVQLVASAAIPSERAPLGIQVMKHGKDFMVDKPGVTSFDQLQAVKQVQAETGRIFSVDFTERFEVKATTRASELVNAGAIGRVIHTCALGPHRLNRHLRPEWFFRREAYGGILVDIGSHQFD